MFSFYEGAGPEDLNFETDTEGVVIMTKHEKGFSIITVRVVLLVLLFFLPLPAAWAGPVPDTGQTKCYNDTVEIPCPSPGQPFYGQDAQYQTGPFIYQARAKRGGSGRYGHPGERRAHDQGQRHRAHLGDENG